ncbi:DNA-methyltransferase [Brevibacillus borstelensis]|uniref:DNA-methyltransferase n=1 Tax=Brevibacillus borstelensis TaxID=45462 RepID=UPI003CE5C204
MEMDQIIQGNTLEVLPTLPEKLFHCCVTSPPYWGLRDYGLPPTDWPEVTYTPMAGLPPITVPAWNGCLGLEPTPEMFVGHMVLVFREVWRVLRDDGTLWMNFGDSYAGAGPRRDETFNEHWHGKHYLSEKQADIERSRPGKQKPSGLKQKDLIGIPWRVAFALQADGWYLRMDNIWYKPNAMPESVRDRPTKAHEYMFLLSKSDRYYYDAESIKEQGTQDEWANGFRGGAYTEGNTFDNQAGGKRTVRGNFKVQQHRPDREPIEYSGMRNKRSVWTVATQPFPEAHFATFPEKLIWPCILAGSPQGGNVLDPFGGSGTTGVVSKKLGRKYILIEMGAPYIRIADERIKRETAQLSIFEFGT